jgi:hypothetical protein
VCCRDGTGSSLAALKEGSLCSEGDHVGDSQTQSLGQPY